MKKEKETQDLIDESQERKEKKDKLNAEIRETFSKRMIELFEQYGIIKDRTITNFNKEIAKKIHTTDKMVSNYILGKAPCSPAALVAIAEYFTNTQDKHGDFHIISVDYLLGRTDQGSMTNDHIHKETGLSNKAIDKLRRMQRDDLALTTYSFMLKDPEAQEAVMMASNVPALSALISSSRFEALLHYFKKLTWNEAHYNQLIETSRYNGKEFTPIDPEDNLPINVDNVFLKAVVERMIENTLSDISETCSKNRKTFEQWYDEFRPRPDNKT